jgi:hypothetical protein
MHGSAFQNRHKFQDEVWGEIKLNSLERDVVDTPEFQRLFRTSQLGFVELVYPAANHTRGAHSIGVCHMAKKLVRRLLENTANLRKELDKLEQDETLTPTFDISPSETVLITLGALLHDISHVPLSHDLEKKSHIIPYDPPLKIRSWYGHYDKHDDYQTNPVLFLLICDDGQSLLARVLRYYSRPFWEQLKEDANDSKHTHIKRFVDLVAAETGSTWKAETHLLPQLLFHLLFFEKLEEAADPLGKETARSFDEAQIAKPWHLGPEALTDEQVAAWHNAWYQPFRHDIIGNTLSADLIDYLARDPQHLGTKRQLDLHLLNYYVVVNADYPHSTPSTLPKYRCAIDVQDHKRGTTRTFLLNDIFRLLDLRQEIHEKAVVHRVVQSANSMLARGLLLLGESTRPRLEAVVGLAANQYFPLQCEDLLFDQLIKLCRNHASTDTEQAQPFDEARRLFEKLVERRVYRPLMIIPGDWAAERLPLPHLSGRDANNVEFSLRSLAAIVDSAFYSPFLLFVSFCVEKYLEGSFDTDTELCAYIESIASSKASPAMLADAISVVPSRVIIWTTPYKQLYKDPGLVVALAGAVGPIDKLAKSDSPVHDESTRVRLETAVGDADSKYASLWRLYVFISDGLYYSGLLDKLLRKLPSKIPTGPPRDSHERRIENSKALLSSAFESICTNWSGLASKEDNKKGRLESRMDTGVFGGLVSRWVGAYKDLFGRLGELSSVEVRHYCHGYALDPDLPEEQKLPCRDIRYKFDNSATEAWKYAEANVGSIGNKLIHFLKGCQITDPLLLSDLEFASLAKMLTGLEALKLSNIVLEKITSNSANIPNALKMLWWPSRNLFAEQPQPVIAELPQTPIQLERWLHVEVAILKPNVRRRITEEWKPLISALQSAIDVHGAAVLTDFRLRIQNESQLLWNDVRVGRIVRALRNRWKLEDLSSTEPELDLN